MNTYPDNKRKVLIVEDEHALAGALATVCQRTGAHTVLAPSGGKALELLQEELATFQLVILDIGLPDMSGLDVLRKAFPENSPLPVPVLVITAHGNLENAIAAQKLGVAEYLLKPLDLHGFQAALKRLLRREESPPAEAAPPRIPVESETTLIGAAPAMQPVFRNIAHACTTKVPIVITGETGVGKSLTARLIHANSDFQPEQLIIIDCDATGGFPHPGTDATVVFENIEFLSASGQGELLRLIEDPGSKVRMVATTRASLHDRVAAGEFREDLYYRIHVLEIQLPELRDRADDIPALAFYFLGRAESDRALTVSREAADALAAYHWPGNVLELRNAVEYAVSICGGSQILPQHLPAAVTLKHTHGHPRRSELERVIAAYLDDQLASERVTYADLTGELEGILLQDLLDRFDGKPSRLASALGMNRTTLRRKCAQLL